MREKDVEQDSVVYIDGDQVRRLRGRITNEDENGFVIVERANGTVKILLSTVQRLEYANQEEEYRGR